MQRAEILQSLKEKTAGVFFMSESDYPFEVVNWDNIEPTEQFLLGIPSEYPSNVVEEADFGTFYEKYAARSPEYKPFLDILRDNLTDLKVYRVGRVNIGIFIVGKSEEGAWLGVSTRSVET
jgi:hypothetical protein